jgi:Flp pilus assembly protein TadG
MAWLRSRVKDFGGDRAGSVALMFVLVVFILVFIIGIAVDFGRAERASADVVGSIDSAALAGAKAMVEQDLSDGELTLLVDHYLDAQLGQGQLYGATYSNLAVVANRNEGTVQIDVDVHVPTTFTRIAQKNTIDVHKFSKTTYKIKNVELAMVLDTTGSMNGQNKIDELKAAANQAIDILLPAGKPSLNRIALAPYSESVNAGPFAAAVSGGQSVDCVVERAGADAYNDVAGTSSPVGWVNLGGGACPNQTVIPLSKDAAALKAEINTYNPGGGTAGHIGLAWGWYLISPNWSPLYPTASQPKAYDDALAIKAIILMTDGAFNKAYFNDTSPAQAALLCEAIKTQNIKLFTIGFELGADQTARDLLSTCASDDGAGVKEFYDATNGTDLSDAFKKIAGKLASLRLSN